MDETVKTKLIAFFSQYTHQKYKKGDMLIRADENPNGVLFLIKGTIKMYVISEKGTETVLNIFKPASFFPMTWAIHGVDNNYFYEALTDVDVWCAPKDTALTFIKESPDILFDLVSRMYKGLDGMFTRITHLMSGHAYSRLIVEIIISSKRFGKKIDGKTQITITEKDLALNSGLTRETVSREMSVLKRKKLVFFNKKQLEITNLDKLTAELS